MDDDEEVYTTTDYITLYVKFAVDQNGEYDFSEYSMKQSIDNLRRYVRDSMGSKF